MGKALELLKTSEELYIKDKIQSSEFSQAKARVGHIYCRLGQYDQAMTQGFNEILYILDHPVNVGLNNLLKAYIYLGVGEVLLRRGQPKEAIESLTKSIKICSQLVGDEDTNNARTYRAEAWIKLKNYSEGYKDCIKVSSVPISQKVAETNHCMLNYLVCFYHAAFIKYRQGDPKKSMEHFADFIKNIKVFFKGFLEEKTYQDLDYGGAFTIFTYDPKHVQANLRRYLKNSCAIFTAIYGPSHPFVKDYILPNATDPINPWHESFVTPQVPRNEEYRGFP
jgi:tetratricopeptide (TPR) repeat protein